MCECHQKHSCLLSYSSKFCSIPLDLGITILQRKSTKSGECYGHGFLIAAMPIEHVSHKIAGHFAACYCYHKITVYRTMVSLNEHVSHKLAGHFAACYNATTLQSIGYMFTRTLVYC